MRRVSIRQRLTAWYAAALLLALLLFGGAMSVALERRLVAGVTARLTLRLQGLASALEAEGEIHDRAQLATELSEFLRDNPDGGQLELRDMAGGSIGPAAPLAPVQRGRRFLTATRTLRCAGETFTAIASLPLDEASVILADFRGLLLWMIPAVLAVATVGGYWLSSRALKPVDEITSVARTIGVRNLSQRIPTPATGDELQRMAETWNAVLERLEAAVQRIRQFTSDASHELRTPLTLIRATADLALRREREPQEYRESLRQIAHEAEHMTALTESLLHLARADAGGLTVTLSAVDLNSLVKEVVEQHAAVAEAQGIELQARTDAHAAMAQADAEALRRVLLILVDNALKHTPAGGRVTVSAEGTVLTVEDTGAGIPAASLPHVFERFYRADEARGAGGGFGLGLAIAQSIAEAHGARITAESGTGVGSRFSLALKS